MANNCLSEPLWQFWFSQGQVNNRWGFGEWHLPWLRRAFQETRPADKWLSMKKMHSPSLRELPDPWRPWWAETTPQSKPTPMHIHFLGTEVLLTAPEDKLQRLFKKYAKSKQTFVSQKSQIASFHPVLLSWASSHLPLYLPPLCPSIDPFPIHVDPHIL